MDYISYCRVSTRKQEKSGLGLDAQKTAVRNFLNSDDILLGQYQEAESGKDNQRPELHKAIEHCKATGATLLIAKLDRLSRNAAFILTLRDSKIQFICVDMPTANNVTIGIMAILAQDERERISQRTKVALAELKAKGKKLGSPKNLSDKSRAISLQVRQNNALRDENNKKATAMIVLMKNSGKSFYSIAKHLNENGFKTRNEKLFSQMSVKRLFDRHLTQQ